MAATSKKTASPSVLRSVVENPSRLKVVLSALFLAGWYFGIHAPLSGKIEERTTTIKAERDRLELAKLVDHLRNETARVSARIPDDSDGNEWIAFLMNQVRKFPLKLVSLDPRPPTEVGPYKVVSFRMAVEGKYMELERLLRSIETSPRILRVELAKISPKLEDSSTRNKRASQNMELQLHILGVISNPDREKPERKGSDPRT